MSTLEREEVPGRGRSTDGVRITAVHATPVNIPLEAPYRWSRGIYPGFSKTVVEVETSAGVNGLGEAPTSQAASIIREAIAPALAGMDPRRLNACERAVLDPIEALQNTEDHALLHAYGGVELALWDVIGKLEGRSIAELLGGRVRDEILFTEYFALRLRHEGCGGESTPADMARYCAQAQEAHGSTLFEGKVAVETLALETKMLREIRAAVGDQSTIRLDANMGWTTTVAREAIARFAAHNVQSIEEPVRTLEELARLRGSTVTSFSSHEPNLRVAVRLGVPDAFVINLTALGGIRRSLQFVAACQELGFDVWFYSPDTGIATAAYLQIASATEWIHLPSQTLLRWHRDDVIAEGPFRPDHNRVQVPSGAGLGVTLDRNALERCHRRFVEEGPYDQYAGVTPGTRATGTEVQT